MGDQDGCGMKTYVRCNTKNAALHGCPLVWQFVSVSESAAPPILKCELWNETSPAVVPFIFTSTKTAPGRTSATVKSISEISATPVSPGLPTWNMTWGFAELENFAPDAEISDKTSPTMREPGGT